MKKTILSFLSIAVISCTAFSQIPNNDFETWTSAGAYSTPDNWETLNSTTAIASVYTCTKGTTGAPSGTSFLKLTSKTVGPTVANGIAVSGVLDPLTMTPVSGFPYTGEPLSLTGKWQHMIFGSSQGSVSVMLTKWNAGTNLRETVASGSQTLSGMAMSWATFNIDLTYAMPVAPDSCIIVLKASGITPTDGDYLWVDNLAFTGSVAGLHPVEKPVSTISVYPNPSSENISIQFGDQKVATVQVKMIDNTGKIVRDITFNKSIDNSIQTINVSNLRKGTYFMNIIENGIVETKEVIIQ